MQDFLSSFLYPKTSFSAFTSEHYLPLIIFSFLTAFIILIAKNKSKAYQNKMGSYLAIFVLSTFIIGLGIQIATKQFNWEEDLPLYVCHVICFVMPFVMKQRSSYWFGVFYFWVLAGTAQGLITPDIEAGWPYVIYLRYWTLHCGLVSVVVYGLVVYKMKIQFKHLAHSIFWMLIFFVLCLSFNLLFETNYNYLMEKPPVATSLSFLGEWPLYLVQGFFFVMVLFALLFIPFAFRKKTP